MDDAPLLDLFGRFGLVMLLGLLIGLERQQGSPDNPHTGVRDFVMFALLGGVGAFAADLYDSAWILVAAFLAVVGLMLSGYWLSVRNGRDGDAGLTTEIAAILTFLTGVLVLKNAMALAIALSIIMLVVLSQKAALVRFSVGIRRFELEAALKLLVITFIVLPVLPNRSLDSFATVPAGTVIAVAPTTNGVTLKPRPGFDFEAVTPVELYLPDEGHIGQLRVESTSAGEVSGRFHGKGFAALQAGVEIHSQMGGRFLGTVLGALKPYKIWLIVVLVSSVSFVGYVLIKLLGSGAGILLTGIVGGLASSTVTTLSFSKRSREVPQWSRPFAAAVVLASAVMFPRLLLQIGIVNQALMKNVALPVLVMGATGLVMAGFFFFGRSEQKAEASELSVSNPFSLQSAITFGLVFSAVLIATRLALTYLGNTWLPLIAFLSGLTDADAIAFSVSDAQQAGIITLDWASFNLVLGALANTFMKLLLVFMLGHRALFKRVLVSFLVIGIAGIVTMAFYYDF